MERRPIRRPHSHRLDGWRLDWSANAARIGARTGTRLSHQYSLRLQALARVAAGRVGAETFGRRAPARHPRAVAATGRRARHAPARKARTGLVQPDYAECDIRL